MVVGYTHRAALAAVSETAPVPPRTTRLVAPSSVMASLTAGCMQPRGVTLIGAASCPASAAPATASGKFSPVARNVVRDEPGGKYARLMSAAVS